MNTKRETIGWYGETLNAVLDRRPARTAAKQPTLVGYDPRDLAKLLG